MAPSHHVPRYPPRRSAPDDLHPEGEEQFPARTETSGICSTSSSKNVLAIGDENAGAAPLAPEALVDRSRCAMVIVARDEFASIDPQLAAEKMQFFHVRMSVGRVACARRQPNQHARALPFLVN